MPVIPMILAARITLVQVFIVSIILKFLFIIFIVWMIRVIKREDRATEQATAAPTLLATVAPARRVAIVYCPFCQSDNTASVRRETVGAQTVYELVCWSCHAALPETALVAVVDPSEWLQRTANREAVDGGS